MTIIEHMFVYVDGQVKGKPILGVGRIDGVYRREIDPRPSAGAVGMIAG
jgi:hypothetical protein